MLTEPSTCGLWINPPCHHPAWPMSCPDCGKVVDGTQINLPLAGNNGMVFQEGYRSTRAVSFQASSCEGCRLVAIRRPGDGAEIIPNDSQEAGIVEAFRRSFYFASGTRFEWRAGARPSHRLGRRGDGTKGSHD